MIWSLIKSFFFWLLGRTLLRRRTSTNIIKLKEKVDALTSKLANEMRKHPLNRKRVNRLRFDIKLFNRRIARLSERD